MASLKLLSADRAITSLFGELAGHLLALVFAALVAWAAVAGGGLGLGFAIFVAFGYLSDMRESLAKLAKET